MTQSPARDAAQVQLLDSLREVTHRAQRAFLVVNAVPFTVGIVLSCFTDVPAVAMYGKFTLGMAWGVAQCALFIATAWIYDVRSTRSSDLIEQALTSDALPGEVPGAATFHGFRR
ncbi:hypothetical protein OG885_09525 [Streptomyces sp. NBC_00028]|uniref:hypothetical protein n=1 Tax=Streptomyces sp. NBC_00028 TaxID=2975624 RepID=UPI00324B22F0